MSKSKVESPYPKLGEIIRTIAVALDTKKGNREFDRYSREGDYDFRLREKMLKEAVIDPSEEVGGLEFASFLSGFSEFVLTSYIDLMLKVALDGVKRSESLPLLGAYYFSYQLADLLLQLSQRFHFPIPFNCDYSNAQAINAVFDWTEVNVPNWSEFYSGLEKENKDKIARWRKGEELPRFKSIKEFPDWSVKNKKLSQANKYLIRRNLLIARAIEFCKKEEGGRNLLQAAVWYIRNGMKPCDIGLALGNAQREIVSRYSDLMQPVSYLVSELDPTTEKKAGSQDDTREKLDALREVRDRLDPAGLTSYIFEMFEGRWLIFSGRYKEALKFYKKALESSLYLAGPMQERIMKEALVLAARRDDRAFLKKLKNQMIAFGLQMEISDDQVNYLEINNSKSRSKDCVVEDWEVKQWAGLFDLYFPKSYFFYEYENDGSKELSGTFGPMVLSIADIESLKPDKRYPDRMVSVKGHGQKKAPQLNWFVQQNSVEDVRALLEKGASVNIMSENGESPILMAIEALRPDNQPFYQDDTCFKVIADKPHAPSTLNWKTTKKQLTPLTSAIYTGRPDIVGKLLEMGADVNFRGAGDQTALNICMNLIADVRDRERHNTAKEHNNPSKNTLEFMRRNMAGMAGITLQDHEAYWERIGKDQKNNELFKAVVSVSKNLSREHLHYDYLVMIVKLLLDAGADPNAEHSSPVTGYTPLMLAAEIDEAKVFELMLGYGGNPKLCYLHKGILAVNCWDIAREFNATHVLSSLADWGAGC